MDLFKNRNEDGDSTSAAESVEEEGDSKMSGVMGKRIRKKTKIDGFVSITEAHIDLSEEEDDHDNGLATKRRRLQNGRISSLTGNNTRQSSRINSIRSSRQSSQAIKDNESSESEEEAPKPRKAAQTKSNGASKTRSSGRNTRSSGNKPSSDTYNISQSFCDEDEDVSQHIEEESDNSDIVYDTRKSKRPARQKFVPTRSQAESKRSQRRRARSLSSEPGQPARRSGRDRVSKNMREQDMDEELYADEVATTNTPKVISIREIYQPVEPKSLFASLHSNVCDVCSGTGSNSNKGKSPLIYCQGCSSSIHKVCLGYRSGREHMVTKIGHENFVMQCRRCIGVSIKKDPSAPRLDVCQGCGEVGAACAAFSSRKTSKMEEKIREENGGDDPITEVSPDLINNAENLLFRCTRCQRGCHFAHLPALKKSKTTEDEDELRNMRRKEYGNKFKCKDCVEFPDKPSGLVAWRLAKREDYKPGDNYYDFTEDEKEYLIKWFDQSYFQCVWMPGSWVWGVTATVMRKAFANRDEGNNLIPKWKNEEAIPEEFLRMEIVFDVEYESDFESGTEKFEKEQINLVDRVLVKFSGLGYEDAVWESPPPYEDKERWRCFVAAYNEYVVGVHFKNPSQSEMKKRSELFHALNFEKKVEVKKQPASLIGGELMAYQKEGMNWMLYNYHQKKNVILADEMGLGKTIQVIALLATLITEKPKVSYPLSAAPTG
jgi:chromodomain-helicase-DNA-binding protein 4